jgi:hypothetical protein
MQFLLHLWLSQYPSLIGTEEGNHQAVLQALLLTHNGTSGLSAYERGLLKRVARRHMTVGHLLAYLQQHEQA